MEANTLNYRDLAIIALQAARKGREVLLSYFGQLRNVQEKFQAGLVSEADKTSEYEISKFLKEKCPHFGFLGEESAPEELSGVVTSKVPRWILDPLDGTTNYVHGLPIYAVSLGLEVAGDSVVGVIDAPALREVYCAWKGGGAYLNGRRIHVSTRTQFKEALLATGFNSEIEEILANQIGIFQEVVRQARGVRRPGAAAMDLAWVASGAFDGYWELGPKPWDIAAGKILVEEAGGELRNFKGEKYKLFMPDVVASNSHIISSLNQFTAKFART